MLKGTHFASEEEIKDTVTREQEDLEEKDFVKCFHGWQKRMQKWFNCGGGYFEGKKCLSSLQYL